jgi:competence protein ComEA
MKELVLKYRWYALAAAGIGIALFLYFSQNKSMAHQQPSAPVENTMIKADASNGAEEGSRQQATQPANPASAEIFVDIKGAVKKPGIYKADAEDRVYDVIQKAGGFLKNANQSQVNLAQKVKDEMVIQVPKQGDPAPAQPVPGTSSDAAASAASDSGGQTAEKVNINTADEAALETLPGIGPSKAAAMIEYREKNGPFQKPEDLKNVSGIGDQTYANIESAITVQ